MTNPGDPLQLPEGAITFLFTDIEGSTRLWESYPDEMQQALTRHDYLLRMAIHEQSGIVVKSTGDGLQAVFTDPQDALKAALVAQRQMAAEQWPAATGQLRVRMALHTATAELREGDYYGSAVNRVARLMAAGHGGQILLSLAIEQLVRDDLPGDVTLLDLGHHKLRDLSRPEHIFQLVTPDLPSQFPDLRTTRVKLSNLPTQSTLFIGREQELAALAELILRDEVNLVTVTGPGGIGKTRLALQAAANMLANPQRPFTDGVFFVNLVPLEDPSLLASAIATVLNVGESGESSLVDSLKDYLRSKTILLLLDNMEHILAGVDLLVELLQAAPGLKILTTSREALNFREEWLFPLNGLPYPSGSPTGDLANYGAVQLFSATAQRVRPDFNLEEELEGVIRICQLVEGMPLAIELAAVWTKSLNSHLIASEIERNVDFLATRMRDQPARHRSMRATFDYSWRLLIADEKKGFSRLSVFRGGFDRQAAEAIADASLTILTSLGDRSLLRWDPQANRYRVHELLRQYAVDHLYNDPGQFEMIHDAHCVYFADYCWQMATAYHGGQVWQAFESINADHENIHAAWRWAISHEKTREVMRCVPALSILFTNKSHYFQGIDEFEAALRLLRATKSRPNIGLAVATTLVELAWLYIRVGRLGEAEASLLESQAIYQRLDIPPALPGQATDPALGLGIIASIRGDYALLEQYGLEALETSKEFDQLLNQELSYYLLTRSAVAQGNYELALQRAKAMSAIIQETKDEWLLAYCLLELGNAYLGLGDRDSAMVQFQEAYLIRERFEDPEGMAVALTHMGKVRLRQNNHEKAQDLFQRSQVIYQEIGDRGGLATATNGLANTAVGQDRFLAARRNFQDALSVAAGIHFVPLALAILAGMGQLLLKIGQSDRAREILNFVSANPAAEFETRQLARESLAHHGYERHPDRNNGGAGDESAQTLDQVIQIALADFNQLDLTGSPVKSVATTSGSAGQASGSSPSLVEPLTDRELEILEQIAAGLTNKQIAESLILSVGTVKWYTSQIYSKLNTRNRTQAVARARDLDLLP